MNNTNNTNNTGKIINNKTVINRVDSIDSSVEESTKKSQDKNTEWIKNRLLESDDLDQVMEEVLGSFVEDSFSTLINEWLIQKGVKKSEVIEGSGLSTPYVYELFKGAKIPTRDKCIQLAFGLKLTFSETQKLLKTCELSELYSRVKRDAVIIFCINKEMGIYNCDDMLDKMGEETLLNE